MSRKIIMMLAATAALTSTAASAGNIFFSFGSSEPVYSAPIYREPVYVQQRPVVYYREYYGPGYVRYVPVYQQPYRQPVYYSPPPRHFDNGHHHGHDRGPAPQERWNLRNEHERRQNTPRSW